MARVIAWRYVAGRVPPVTCPCDAHARAGRWRRHVRCRGKGARHPPVYGTARLQQVLHCSLLGGIEIRVPGQVSPAVGRHSQALDAPKAFVHIPHPSPLVPFVTQGEGRCRRSARGGGGCGARQCRGPRGWPRPCMGWGLRRQLAQLLHLARRHNTIGCCRHNAAAAHIHSNGHNGGGRALRSRTLPPASTAAAPRARLGPLAIALHGLCANRFAPHPRTARLAPDGVVPCASHLRHCGPSCAWRSWRPPPRAQRHDIVCVTVHVTMCCALVAIGWDGGARRWAA